MSDTVTDSNTPVAVSAIQNRPLPRVVTMAQATEENMGTVDGNLVCLLCKSKTKSAVVLALAVILGGMLGIFVLLILNALIKKD